MEVSGAVAALKRFTPRLSGASITHRTFDRILRNAKVDPLPEIALRSVIISAFLSISYIPDRPPVYFPSFHRRVRNLPACGLRVAKPRREIGKPIVAIDSALRRSRSGPVCHAQKTLGRFRAASPARVSLSPSPSRRLAVEILVLDRLVAAREMKRGC